MRRIDTVVKVPVSAMCKDDTISGGSVLDGQLRIIWIEGSGDVDGLWKRVAMV
jgi:hypothetical protein